MKSNDQLIVFTNIEAEDHRTGKLCLFRNATTVRLFF